MTLPQATGVVGNLMAESGYDLNPDAFNSSEGGMGAYGIAQWRGDRQQGLQDYFRRMQSKEPKDNKMEEEQSLLSMLQGGIKNFMQPQQGQDRLYNRGEQFAMALDPLIHPNFRGGKQIAENAKASKAYEMQQQGQTRTLAVLQQLCNDGDKAACSVAQSVEARAVAPKDAMTIYYRQKFAKPTKTAVQKTGAEINAEMKAAGRPESYDPDKIYNVFNTGDIKEVNSGISITNQLGQNTSKLLEEQSIKSQNEFVAANSAARESLNTIETQRRFMMDENFESGFGQEFLTNTKKFLSRLGFEGGADVASIEQFMALSSQQILDSLGGSLGTGVSDGDVSLMRGMVTNVGMTKKGIRDYLRVLEAIEKGKQRKYEFYKIYIAEQQKDIPKNERTYIIDNPYKFDMDFHDWVQTRPSLLGET